jgi:hypothetical protein
MPIARRESVTVVVVDFSTAPFGSYGAVVEVDDVP